MTSKKVQDLGEQLLQRGRSPASNVVMLPVSEMPMVLTLDQLRPNPDNPRTTPNPKYDEIKASIMARGLDSVPKVACFGPIRPSITVLTDHPFRS
ncbi:hypothetical protein [Serratia sp. DD3]|uniref:hypothetical protein n=1 Tax=Serratia sp. DD3 TaxID=1410619 RepID=UPI0003C52194|nr:integrating conjugative element, PFGI_1 class, ParB family protein [Serratia sp. DD3]